MTKYLKTWPCNNPPGWTTVGYETGIGDIVPVWHFSTKVEALKFCKLVADGLSYQEASDQIKGER